MMMMRKGGRERAEVGLWRLTFVNKKLQFESSDGKDLIAVGVAIVCPRLLRGLGHKPSPRNPSLPITVTNNLAKRLLPIKNMFYTAQISNPPGSNLIGMPQA